MEENKTFSYLLYDERYHTDPDRANVLTVSNTLKEAAEDKEDFLNSVIVRCIDTEDVLTDHTIIEPLSLLEIFEEVYNYYKEDVTRRGIYKLKCQYFTEDGKMCAVGYLSNDPSKIQEIGEELLEEEESEGSGVQAIIKHISLQFLDIKYQYSKVTPSFLSVLQEFHDDYNNWDKKGITEEGEKMADKIREQYREY